MSHGTIAVFIPSVACPSYSEDDHFLLFIINSDVAYKILLCGIVEFKGLICLGGFRDVGS